MHYKYLIVVNQNTEPILV